MRCCRDNTLERNRKRGAWTVLRSDSRTIRVPSRTFFNPVRLAWPMRGSAGPADNPGGRRTHPAQKCSRCAGRRSSTKLRGNGCPVLGPPRAIWARPVGRETGPLETSRGACGWHADCRRAAGASISGRGWGHVCPACLRRYGSLPPLSQERRSPGFSPRRKPRRASRAARGRRMPHGWRGRGTPTGRRSFAPREGSAKTSGCARANIAPHPSGSRTPARGGTGP